VDGEALTGKQERVYNAGLYGMPCYALGHVVVPDADPADGAAEAIVSRSAGAYWKGLARGVRLHGNHSIDASIRRFRVAVIETDEPLQVDGESVAMAAIEVRVKTGAFRVIVKDEGSLVIKQRGPLRRISDSAISP
jgi:diacylglycerol kinase family enzyme